MIDKTLHLLKQCGITQIERDFGTNEVTWEIKGSEKEIEKFSALSAKR